MKQEPTDDSVIVKHLFGQCSYGAPNDLNKHDCPGMYQRWYVGKVGSGRVKKDGPVYLDEYHKCTCQCHIPEDERPKPRRTRKKAAPKTRRKK